MNTEPDSIIMYGMTIELNDAEDDLEIGSKHVVGNDKKKYKH
jgi:hypothetical protein